MSNNATQSETSLLLIVSVTKFIGVLGLLILPLLVGGFIDGLDIGEIKAGMLATTEVFCLGISQLLVSFGMIRLQPSRLAVAGSVVLIIGILLSIIFDVYNGLLVARGISGLGMGMISAAATMTIATAFVDPDKAAGKVYALIYVASAMIYLVSPYLSQLGEYRGLLMFLGVIVILAIPLHLRLPDIQIDAGHDTTIDNNFPWKSIILLISGVAIIFTGLGACWSFAERLGLDSGLNDSQVSVYLAWSVAATVVGATTTGWLGTRLGRGFPIHAGIIISALACFLMSSTGLSWTFIPGLMLYQAGTAFLIPYMLGTAAALDSTGRLAAAVIGSLVFFYGAGSTLGGWVIETFSLAALGWVAVICAAVSILLFIMLITRMNNDRALVAATT